MPGQYQVLVEYTLAAALHSLAAVRIALIFRNMLRFRLKGSEFLIALLVNWFVLCVLILPYELFGVFSWRIDDDGKRNGYVLFGLGLPPHVFGLGLIPVSVFFLTLERICIIRLKLAYNTTIRRRLFIAYAFVLSAGVLVVASAYYKTLPSLQLIMPCLINGCVLGQWVLLYLGWRAFCSILNFSSGVIFFVLLYKTRVCANDAHYHARNAQRKNNLMTLLAIISEFFLAFIPHFFPFVWEEINGAGSSMWTGPLSEMASAIEVTLFTVIYARLFQNQQGLSPPGIFFVTTSHPCNSIGGANVASTALARHRHTLPSSPQDGLVNDKDLARLRQMHQRTQLLSHQRFSLTPLHAACLSSTAITGGIAPHRKPLERVNE